MSMRAQAAQRLGWLMITQRQFRQARQQLLPYAREIDSKLPVHLPHEALLMDEEEQQWYTEHKCSIRPNTLLLQRYPAQSYITDDIFFPVDLKSLSFTSGAAFQVHKEVNYTHHDIPMERGGIEILGFLYSKEKRGNNEYSKLQNYRLLYKVKASRGTILYHEVQTICMNSFDLDVQRLPPQAAYHLYEYVMLNFRPYQQLMKLSNSKAQGMNHPSKMIQSNDQVQHQMNSADPREGKEKNRQTGTIFSIAGIMRALAVLEPDSKYLWYDFNKDDLQGQLHGAEQSARVRRHLSSDRAQVRQLLKLNNSQGARRNWINEQGRMLLKLEQLSNGASPHRQSDDEDEEASRGR